MKKKILLTFPRDRTEEPVTYNLIKNYDLMVNILRASIAYNVRGSLLIEVEGTEEQIGHGIDYLREIGLDVNLLKTKVIRDEETCNHCGACTAVCAIGALAFAPDWQLVYEPEKCISCKLCITACPTKSIRDYK